MTIDIEKEYPKLKATNEGFRSMLTEKKLDNKQNILIPLQANMDENTLIHDMIYETVGCGLIDVAAGLRDNLIEIVIQIHKEQSQYGRKKFPFTNQHAKGLKPDPILTVSEWADRYRMLTSKTASRPGPWQTSITPYLKKIMDCLSCTSDIERVVFMKASQIGATEAGNNFFGYAIHHIPGPMLYVLPTVEAVKRASKQRISTMIEESPVLRDRVSEPRSRDSGNTTLLKEFPGGSLAMTGANSSIGLREMAARYLFLDEVDAYPQDVSREGDPINLAIKRTQTFTGKRKIFIISTPTLKGFSRIEKAYADTDQQRYYVPCPECGEKQPILWPQIKWENDDPKTTRLICRNCNAKIPEEDKEEMLEKGEWVAEGEAKNDKVIGFHLSALYSPSQWYPWSQAVEEYLEARDDSALMKAWVNTTLGETWDEPGTKVDPNMLYYRRESYESEVPKDVLVITAGVDIQGDRIEAEAVGWSQDKESWSIDYRIFFGDPDQPEVWNELDEWLTREWKHATNHRLQIQAACIDSGGHHTQNVYSFCKFRQRRRVFAIKGVAGFGRAIVSSPSKKRSGTERRPVPLFTVGVDTTKEIHYSRLLKTEQGPGYCHFPNQEPPYSEQFFEQLTAEKLVTKTAHGIPKPVWELPSGKRNEALDCRVYAIAALELLRPDFAKWQEHLETEAMTDKQREYFKNRKKVIDKFSQKRCKARTGWMADVLGGPAFPDYK